MFKVQSILPKMLSLLILVVFPRSSSLEGIHQNVDYIPAVQQSNLQPLYLRNRNSFYERYIRPPENSQEERSNTNPSLKAYPDINKDKGNVFKPKPLRPGPWIQMSTGEIWPKPKFQTTNSVVLDIDVNSFSIKVN